MAGRDIKTTSKTIIHITSGSIINDMTFENDAQVISFFKLTDAQYQTLVKSVHMPLCGMHFLTLEALTDLVKAAPNFREILPTHAPHAFTTTQ
jgi:hypothetical protein